MNLLPAPCGQWLTNTEVQSQSPSVLRDVWCCSHYRAWDRLKTDCSWDQHSCLVPAFDPSCFSYSSSLKIPFSVNHMLSKNLHQHKVKPEKLRRDFWDDPWCQGQHKANQRKTTFLLYLLFRTIPTRMGLYLSRWDACGMIQSNVGRTFWHILHNFVCIWVHIYWM